ncbi:hypothetical protein BKA63DRAFT_589852 [Paraphoma chrysanthemicola]|nr:hypothetical protein BKA63DRAFT_589852 [Paraphoma chrysanthemicola]
MAHQGNNVSVELEGLLRRPQPSPSRAAFSATPPSFDPGLQGRTHPFPAPSASTALKESRIESGQGGRQGTSQSDVDEHALQTSASRQSTDEAAQGSDRALNHTTNGHPDVRRDSNAGTNVEHPPEPTLVKSDPLQLGNGERAEIPASNNDSSPHPAAPSPSRGNATRPREDGIISFFSKNLCITLIALGFAVNFAEWMTVVFLVLQIDLHDEHPVRYAAQAWACVFLGSLVVLGPFIYCGIYVVKGGSSPKHNTREGSLTIISFFIVEVFSFVLVLAYFYSSAIPQYESYKWDRETEFKIDLQPPAVALFGDYNDAVSASLMSDWSTCWFPRWTKNKTTLCSEQFPNKLQWMHTETYGTVSYYHYKPADETQYKSISDQLDLQALVTLKQKLTAVQGNSSDIRHWYNTQNPQGSVLYAVLYDQRLSTDELRLAFDCGILGWTEIPALGSNTFTITASRVHDKFDKIDVKRNATCHNFTSQTYAKDDPPYTTYRFHLSSSGSVNSSSCDVGVTGTPQNHCLAQILIRYETFLVSTDTTARKIDKNGIFLNISAIVGAVAFVAAFLTMYEI